jgi:hypothetical protein
MSRHHPAVCSFCMRCEAIDAADLSVEQRNAAIDALFDRADAAERARRAKPLRRRRWRR